MEDAGINVGHSTVVETLEEARDGVRDGSLEFINELVCVLVEEFVHSLSQGRGLSTKQILKLDVETSESDFDIRLPIDHQSLHPPDVLDGQLGDALHGGVGELGGVGSRGFGLQLEDGNLPVDDVLTYGLGGGQEHLGSDGLGFFISLDVNQLMLRETWREPSANLVTIIGSVT